MNLGPSVNTAAGESRPSLSGDGTRLYFGRNGDIYVSQRAGLADSRTTDAGGAARTAPASVPAFVGVAQSPGSTRQNGWSTGSR